MPSLDTYTSIYAFKKQNTKPYCLALAFFQITYLRVFWILDLQVFFILFTQLIILHNIHGLSCVSPSLGHLSLTCWPSQTKLQQRTGVTSLLCKSISWTFSGSGAGSQKGVFAGWEASAPRHGIAGSSPRHGWLPPEQVIQEPKTEAALPFMT